MKPKVVVQEITQPGITFNVVDWFTQEPEDLETIEEFLALVCRTWQHVNGDVHMTMTLDGSTWLLYIFCEDRVYLLKWVQVFQAFTDEFNRSVGSGRGN